MKNITYAVLDDTEYRCVKEVILPLWHLTTDCGEDRSPEETEVLSAVQKKLKEKSVKYDANSLGDLIWGLIELQAIVHLQSQKSFWAELGMPEPAGLAEMRKVEYLAIRDLNRTLARHLHENFDTLFPEE